MLGTLLNRLFGTNFAVMDEINRKQTTKGTPAPPEEGLFWEKDGNGRDLDFSGCEFRYFGYGCRGYGFEGTRGCAGTSPTARVRTDDEDFERRSALFSLAISEVIIVNLWEQQVGLYQGANLGLLKTVFEVNLQLFQQQRG